MSRIFLLTMTVFHSSWCQLISSNIQHKCPYLELYYIFHWNIKINYSNQLFKSIIKINYSNQIYESNIRIMFKSKIGILQLKLHVITIAWYFFDDRNIVRTYCSINTTYIISWVWSSLQIVWRNILRLSHAICGKRSEIRILLLLDKKFNTFVKKIFHT